MIRVLTTVIGLKTIFFFAGACLVFFPTGFARCDDPLKEYNDSIKLAESIRQDLASRPHDPWEAAYYGMTAPLTNIACELVVSSKLGYSTHHFRFRDDGSARSSNGRINLVSHTRKQGPCHVTDTTEFVSIPWGDRLYLLESNRVVDFCNAVNSGQEPRDEQAGFFLLREGDHKKKAEGLPKVPDPWKEKYLLKAPVNATVLKVIGMEKDVPVPEIPYGTWSGFRCQINVGESQGIHPGMEFFVQSDLMIGFVYVLKSSPKSAEILVNWSDILYTADEITTALKKGAKLSTKRQKWVSK